MGCAQSKIDNEESVARCKERRNLMKEAVVARNAFAAAHSAYSISLKNTGAALSDYGHDEAQATTSLQDDKEEPQPLDSTTPLRPPTPPLDNLLPPPPPLPDFSPSPVKRSVSLPSNVMTVRKNRLNATIVEDDEEEEDVVELEPRGKMSRKVEKNGKKGKGGGGGGGEGEGEMAATVNLNLSPRTPEARPMHNMAWDYFFNVDHHQHHLGGTSLAIEEEEEEEEETTNINNVEQQETVTVNSNVNVNVNHNSNVKNSNVTVDVPKKAVVEEVEEAKSAPPMYTRRSSAATSSTNVNLMQVLNQIDDHFLKASQTAQEVSNLLETTRMHYHSNFADSRGKILST